MDSGLLIRNALRPVLVVCAPAGVLAFGVTLLHLPLAATLGLGLLAAAAYMALMVYLVPRIRADATVLFDFLRRAVSRAGR